MRQPLVSVVMSAYNEERYVRAAVESMLNQTYGKLELIVVDDGSTDSTPDILARIRDSRVRVFRQANGGTAGARNRAIRHARGDFITFMDADDLCDPRRIEKQVKYLMANPDVHGVGTWETVIDANANRLESTRLPCDPAEIRREYAEGRMGLNGAAVMVRSEALQAVGGFREKMLLAQDFDLWLRMTERFRFACLPEHLYMYRIHPHQCSHARKREQKFYHDLAVELYHERLATGTDRLERGEPVAIPELEEEPGSSSYRRDVAWYCSNRRRALARSGQWGAALRFAMKSWWHHPTGWRSCVDLCKTFAGSVFPFTRPHLDTVGASLAEAIGLRRARSVEQTAAKSADAAGRVDQSPEVSPCSVGELGSTLVRDENDFAAVAQEWDALLAVSDTPSSFFLSSISLLPFWRAYNSGRRLTVVLVRNGNGELVGAAPFYVERVGHRLSRHLRLTLLGSPESGADYLDVIARPGYRKAVMGETFRRLKRNGVRWHAINLDYVLDDSPTLDLLDQGRVGHRFWMHRTRPTICPYTKLAPTWDELVAGLGPSTRRGMKYQLNLLRRKFKDVRFELCTDEREITEMLGVLINYKQARYGHWFDYDYLAWPAQAIAAQRAGDLRFWVLRLDGHPACLWFTFLFANRVFFQACSYDPEYGDLRLGKVMMPHAIQSAIAEGATEYDMKRGEASYKYHWANGERRIVQVNAIRHSLRGAWINFWEYGAAMARVRKESEALYRKGRRTGRLALMPVARRWPGALPKRLRDRVLQRPSMSCPQDDLAGQVAS